MKFIFAILMFSLSACALIPEQPYRDAWAAQQAARTPEEIKAHQLTSECVAQANYAVTAQAQTAILRGCMQSKGL